MSEKSPAAAEPDHERVMAAERETRDDAAPFALAAAAVLILLAVAQLSTSVGGLWTGLFASILVALGYLLAASTFALDSLELRARIPADQLHRFDVTIVWALARFGIVELVCLALAACALAAGRSLRRARDTSNRLIVGTSALAAAPSDASLPRRRGTPRYGESVGS